MGPQVFKLLICQLKHEVGREAINVALDCLDQFLGFHTIQLGQILIQNHLITPDDADRTFNPKQVDGQFRLFHIPLPEK